jgi:hypothetical protein
MVVDGIGLKAACFKKTEINLPVEDDVVEQASSHKYSAT